MGIVDRFLEGAFRRNDGSELLLVLLFVVAMGSLPLVGFLIADHLRTPLERQNLHVNNSKTYSTTLAQDGCYWRTYYGSKVVSSIEILPDNTENCPYRK